jgi:CRISPR/Cas system-associated exonuclease Cas4 (RecB family)
MFKSFTHWSFSQWQTYRACRFQARLRYIEHEPEPPKKADDPRDRGSRIHKEVEDYILNLDHELAPELTHFKQTLDDVRAICNVANVEVEQHHYLDANWRPTDKAGKWLVYIPDLRVTGPVNFTADTKTGKKYGNELKHYAQLELYSVCAYIEDPSYEEYESELWYIDQKDIVAHTFTPRQLEKARARIDTEVTKMMDDKIHTPSPNKITCKYCPYSPRGTGVCPVGV